VSVSSQLVAFLQDHLAELGDIRVKRMFGGAGVYCDGVMFGLIANDVLYLKSNDDGARAFEEEGCGPFTYEGKKASRCRCRTGARRNGFMTMQMI